MNKHKKLQFYPQSSQFGFTIIESLMAILVVTILLVGLAPFFALSVAIRVQAKRVNVATQVARTYIDGVRAGNIIPPKMTKNSLDSYAPPSTGALSCPIGYCPAQTPTATVINSQTDLYCIPGNGHTTCTSDNFKDMIVQAIGQIPNNSGQATTDVSNGYRSYLLGVRVYRADAFKYSNKLIAGTTQSSSNGGTGLSSSQAPLMEMTTQMVVTDADQFKKLCTAAGVGGC